MKRHVLLLFAVLFCGASAVMGQNDERLRIAVFDPASAGTSIDDGTKIAVREIISSTIVNTGKYSIVERSLLEKVMEEQKFSNSGAVDEMQATEIGKLAGANKVVLSVVTLTGGRNMLSIKIIDVKTATVERQKVKVVTSGELLDAVEPLTLEMLNIASNSSISIAPTVVKSSGKQNAENNQTVIKPKKKQVTSAHEYVPNGDIIMYGVDYSKVQIRGARENAQQFSQAFVNINAIFNLEPKKYNFTRLSGKNTVVYTQPTDLLIENIDWNYTMKGGSVPFRHSVEDMIRNYDLPHSDGIGLVFIAWLLDRTEAVAHYEVVYFDIATRNILFSSTVSSEAGGASLRNFWANSVYEVIEQKKLRKQIQLIIR